MVKCSGYTFQRINKYDDISMPIGFTMAFQQRSFDLSCNFVANRHKSSDLEKIHKIQDVCRFCNAWKKLENKEGESSHKLN